MRDHVHHVPIIGPAPTEDEVRATVVFDLASGRHIGHSPNFNVEQVSHEETDGVITTTLKITPFED